MSRLMDLLGLGASAGALPDGDADPLVRSVQAQAFARDPEFRRYFAAPTAAPGKGPHHLVDYLFAAHEPQLPREVFDHLRWGGQFVYVSRNPAEVAELAGKFRDRRGFVIEREPSVVHTRHLGLRIPGLSQPAHYFAARKTHLVMPGQMTDRFTYDVQLVRSPQGGYAVLKQIPEYDATVARLRERLPDASLETILKGARKLVEKVFPVFLTREAAFLSILGRDLPAPFNERIPRIIDVQKDGNGFVRKLYLEWMRNGGAPISQLEFAKQSARLLQQLHEKATVIHLDLRLDNFVLTERGVGFVDFGSAVRVGEDLGQNPMLRTLFDEMMQTSQIQRDLGKMVRRGKVTSRMIVDCHQKVDKAVDLFYLAVQMNDPHQNPDFEDLIDYDPQSSEAMELANLTGRILKPKDPDRPAFKTAGDVVAAIEEIEFRLRGRRAG